MRYLGNKESLLHFIDQVFAMHGVASTREEPLTLCDPFTGTTSVARHLKRQEWRAITGDNMTYSYAFQHAYIGLNSSPPFAALAASAALDPGVYLTVPLYWVLAHLNNLRGIEGYFYRTYSPDGNDARRYFTAANALRIDAIRAEINRWWEARYLTEAERYLLCATLIEAVSRVANVAGTYAAYLKKWDPRAHKPLVMHAPQFVHSAHEHRVNIADANELAASCSYDLLYIDPPYNSRQYCNNYHILETLAVGDDPPVRGVAGLRDEQDKRSLYSRPGHAEERLDELVRKSPARWILMSYSSEGIIPEARLVEILAQRGTVEVYACEYKRFRSDADSPSRRYKSNDTVQEMLYWVTAS